MPPVDSGIQLKITLATIMAKYKNQSILVIRTYGLGDIVMSTPIIRKLYTDRGGLCEIDTVTTAPEVFQHNPYVRNAYNTSDFDYSTIKNYNLVVNLDHVTAGNRYMIDQYANIAFGSYPIDCKCEVFSSPDHIKDILEERNLKSKGYVVMHMKHTPPANRVLPQEYWASIVSWLLAETSLHVVQIGSVGDLAFGGHDRLVDLRGATSIIETHALMEQAQSFIGIDSGPFHLARSTSTNMVVMYTITKHEYLYRQTFSNGLHEPVIPKIDCYGCIEISENYMGCHRGDLLCTKSLDVSEALSKIKRCLIPR